MSIWRMQYPGDTAAASSPVAHDRFLLANTEGKKINNMRVASATRKKSWALNSGLIFGNSTCPMSGL